LNGKGILIFFWLIISSTSVVAGSFQGSPEPPCDLAEFGIFDFAPSFLDSVGTECPEVARRAGIEGRVELRIFVNKEGSLECLTILEKAHPILEKQAVLAAQRSTYMPAQQDEAPARGYFDVAYTFSICQWARESLMKVREVDPPLDKTPPMISQVGKRTSKNQDAPRFEYTGVHFLGDVSLKVYEQCLEQIAMKFQGPEKVHLVIHKLVWPSTKPCDYLLAGDLQIHTCTSGCEPDRHGQGRIFSFLNENGEYILMETPGVSSTWIE
jgi:TonB family protein